MEHHLHRVVKHQQTDGNTCKTVSATKIIVISSMKNILKTSKSMALKLDHSLSFICPPSYISFSCSLSGFAP